MGAYSILFKLPLQVPGLKSVEKEMTEYGHFSNQEFNISWCEPIRHPF